MSLQEAYDRVEKLKRLAESSNPHEAALAADRLQHFDIDAARASKRQGAQTEETEKTEEKESRKDESLTQPSIADKTIDVLDTFPECPYHEISQLEACQDPSQTKANWAELHFALVAQAKNIGADAIVDIQLKGTIQQKVLSGTAIKYLNSKDLYILHTPTDADWDADEEARRQEEKERRDEETAPGIG